jgi:hypothetical protein
MRTILFGCPGRARAARATLLTAVHTHSSATAVHHSCYLLLCCCAVMLCRHDYIEDLGAEMQLTFGHLPQQQLQYIRYGDCDMAEDEDEWSCEFLDFRLWQHPFSQYVAVADGVDEHAVRVRDLLNRLSTRGFSV